ncbi:MAG: hypothetical protein H6573_19070 [Lewinellaceae bacterium]|nr:hypothetical protein [Lewinellaceae bacterium]
MLSRTASGGLLAGLFYPGKSVVIDTFLKYLDEKVTQQGHLRRRATHIDLDALRLAGGLREMGV